MNIGRLKAIADREINYISRFNFVMVAYLFFKEVGFYWWYLLIIPFILVWIYIDIKYIMPSELDYLFRKNPFMSKIMKNTEK